MEIEFDPAKSALNAKERDLPFDLAAELDWSAAQTIEIRYVVVAPLRGRLHVVVYCSRGDKRRRAGGCAMAPSRSAAQGPNPARHPRD